MNRSCLFRIAVAVIVTCMIPAVVKVAQAQGSGGPVLVRFSGNATVTGLDIQGMEIPLGSGPFSLDLTVPGPFRTAPDNAGQQTWTSFASEFWLNAPHEAFPRGGMTIQNFITAGREGEPDADFISFGLFNCTGGDCSIAVSSLPNSEALEFEDAVGSLLLPDGTLGTEPLESLGALIEELKAVRALLMERLLDAPINFCYVAAVFGAGGGSGAGNGGPDIRSVSLDGTITDISIVPEPATLVLLAIGWSALVVRRRMRGLESRFTITRGEKQ